MLVNICLVIIGLAALVIGGDFLVKGAVGIAVKVRLSKLVIGMTVVSFGTSAPELIVSLQAAFDNVPELAVGNVIGSNIANLALVLGITVLIFPMPVGINTKKYDWPMMMLASILFYLFALNFRVDRWEGILMFIILIGFMTFLIVNSRKNSVRLDEETAENDIPTGGINIWKYLGLLLLGLICLYFGSQWLVVGASDLALGLGVSKHVIGITIVAFGTSVPELVTSVVAAYRKETDISVGNLVGSNVFNILAVIGLTSAVKPIPIESFVVSWDLIWMLGISFILLPMMFIGPRIGRVSGLILLGSYITYIALLF
ncbi:MAG: calcium/sodium antiporter [Crocinitomicaceae bacterium]|nr:calcium/sodium antiporter [Crocinitomicaceae bacterium]